MISVLRFHLELKYENRAQMILSEFAEPVPFQSLPDRIGLYVKVTDSGLRDVLIGKLVDFKRAQVMAEQSPFFISCEGGCAAV
jgi:hypothetical protein